jgi:uncharacterized protein (DUF952 family)
MVVNDPQIPIIGMKSHQIGGARPLPLQAKRGEDAGMVMLQRTRVYKILSAEDWAVAEQLGYTRTALDEGDGYVHLSTREQVHETLRLHYPGQEQVRLLEYIVEEMGQPIRWEESRGGQLFPHLYSTLQINGAKRVWTLQLDADGVPDLPADIDK